MMSDQSVSHLFAVPVKPREQKVDEARDGYDDDEPIHKLPDGHSSERQHIRHRFCGCTRLRRFAAAVSAVLTRSRNSCKSRYSVSSERGKLDGALGLIR
jgi:hypothetical protein